MSDPFFLARQITHRSSLQTYLTIRFFVEPSLLDYAYSAYAYFRWLDDQIDSSHLSLSDRQLLLKRQHQLITASYSGQSVSGLMPEEELLHHLIRFDTTPNSKLKSYITNFFSIIEFDSHRRHHLVSTQQLDWYSSLIGTAVTDCIQFFIPSSTPYPSSPNQYLAATAAHIVHTLRDFNHDLSCGYLNISSSYIASPDSINLHSPAVSAWVKSRVLLARHYFAAGKQYISQLPYSKCRLAAQLYCLRFEPLLHLIEHDHFIPRSQYPSPALVFHNPFPHGH